MVRVAQAAAARDPGRPAVARRVAVRRVAARQSRQLLFGGEVDDKHEMKVIACIARTSGHEARWVRGVRCTARKERTCCWFINLHWLRMIAIAAGGTCGRCERSSRGKPSARKQHGAGRDKE